MKYSRGIARPAVVAALTVMLGGAIALALPFALRQPHDAQAAVPLPETTPVPVGDAEERRENNYLPEALMDARMSDVRLIGSEDGDLEELQGGKVTFDGRYTRLALVIFTSVRFQGTLHGADLIGCDLLQCDLRKVDLTGADLRDTTYDRHTRWPAGFDPGAAGARRVE